MQYSIHLPVGSMGQIKTKVWLTQIDLPPGIADVELSDGFREINHIYQAEALLSLLVNNLE